MQTCRQILVAASFRLESGTAGSQAEDMEQKAKLVASLYCRHVWVEAMRDSDSFDLATCEGTALALAD